MLGLEAPGFVLLLIAGVKLKLGKTWPSEGLRSVGWERFYMVESFDSLDWYSLNRLLRGHFLDSGSLHPINLIYNFSFQKPNYSDHPVKTSSSNPNPIGSPLPNVFSFFGAET